jgi:hypothetical protein
VRDAGVQNRPIQSLEVIEIVRFTQKKVRPESAGFAGLGVPLRLPPPAMRATSPVNGEDEVAVARVDAMTVLSAGG